MNLSNNNINMTMLNTNNLQFKNKVKNLNNTLEQKQLKNVCDDFEAFFMKQILDVSFKNSKIAGESTGSEIIKSMYTQSLSEQSNGTLGISDMLFQFLSNNKGAKS